jgi:hypothetical protein
LLSLRLHDALDARDSLQDLMRDISRKAQERGMTPEIFESIQGRWAADDADKRK